jgi:hypothetical protein
MARRRLGAAQWAVLIDEWRQSGLSLQEFCRRRGLNPGTMQGWVYKPALKRAIEASRSKARGIAIKASQEATPVETARSPVFLPVQFAQAAAGSQPPRDRTAIEVILSGGRRVAVGPGFDDETLRRVVAMLESNPC